MLRLVGHDRPRDDSPEPDRGDNDTMRTLTPHITAYIRERRVTGTYSPKSLRSVPGRLHSLSDNFGDRPLHHLTEPAILRWLESIGHLSTNSRSAYLASVRQFTAWLVTRQLIRVDPCANIGRIPRATTVPRAQPVEVIAAVLDACADDRERAIIWLMVGLGLRRMEVAGLRWEDYDERDGMIVIRGKGRKERVLPVPSTVAAALRRIRCRGTGPVIRSKLDGVSPVSAERIGGIVTGIVTRSGAKSGPYDGVSGHALRHTFASDVLDECGDLRAVQTLLGHENLSTTAIYLRRRSAAQLRAAVEGRDYAAGVLDEAA